MLLETSEPLTFSFYGWASLEDKMSVGGESVVNTATRSWFVEYDGMVRRYQPDVVRITAGAQDITISLPNRSVLSLRRGLSEDNV